MSRESIERLIEKRRKRGRELHRAAGVPEELIRDAYSDDPPKLDAENALLKKADTAEREKEAEEN